MVGVNAMDSMISGKWLCCCYIGVHVVVYDPGVGTSVATGPLAQLVADNTKVMSSRLTWTTFSSYLL